MSVYRTTGPLVFGNGKVPSYIYIQFKVRAHKQKYISLLFLNEDKNKGLDLFK